MAIDTCSTTPTPGNLNGKPQSRLLTIRILWAENLALPSGTALLPVVQATLSSQQTKVAASISPSRVTQNRLANRQRNRDSVQRTQCWRLPYLVVELEVNQVLKPHHIPWQ